MKKIMFNDKYGLTTYVFEGLKTMTRRNKDNYEVGEVVAIAQRYSQIEKEIENLGLPLDMKESVKKHKGYGNKMFVKAEDMPHHIKIKSKRIEHLQSISNSDCLKEGIIPYEDPNRDDNSHSITGYTFTGGKIYDTPYEAFKALIIKLNGPNFWYSNPKVFVFEFELVD